MKRLSARMLVNQVTIRKATFSPDAAGGRTITLGSASAPIPCTVQEADGEDVPENMRESQVKYSKVLFNDDQALATRDQLTWVDGGNQTLVVRSYVNEAGRSQYWKAICQDRPVK